MVLKERHGNQFHRHSVRGIYRVQMTILQIACAVFPFNFERNDRFDCHRSSGISTKSHFRGFFVVNITRWRARTEVQIHKGVRAISIVRWYMKLQRPENFFPYCAISHNREKITQGGTEGGWTVRVMHVVSHAKTSTSPFEGRATLSSKNCSIMIQ